MYDWPGFCELKFEFRGNLFCYDEEVETLERKIMTRFS